MALNAKYCFSDVGLRNRLTRWRGGYRGQLLENIVYHELLVRSMDRDWGSDHQGIARLHLEDWLRAGWLLSNRAAAWRFKSPKV